MKRLLSLFLGFVFIYSLAACSNNSRKLTGEEIYSKIALSTVEVYADSDYQSCLGSGFYIDNFGTVITNYHVIENCSSAYVTASDDRTYEVTGVVGYSEELDVAILATEQTNSAAVEICASVTTGETIYVLGSSLGLTGTFSEGLVSTAERNIDGVSYIQISAPISHGNSGGPVVNSFGQVIGIASAGFDEGQNLNLALPITVIDRISTGTPISMNNFFNSTSDFAQPDVGQTDKTDEVGEIDNSRVVTLGSSLAVRTITLDSIMAEYVLAKWERGEATEATMIAIMDQYGSEQGGGQLYIIDPGVFSEEIDAWCFDSSRKPGDYTIIENSYGYTICYISMLNS